jgi:anthranilate phosphoribosyltransferase
MSTAQEQLIVFLKKKGTGPTMSKSLLIGDLASVEMLFKNDEAHLTTKATLLTALLTLEPNADESDWLEKVTQSPQQFLPQELIPLLPQHTTTDPFLILIHRVIQHQDLCEKSFLQALEYIFNPAISDHYKAAFLEAERLKRESKEENLTCLLDFIYRSTHHRIDIPFLIDLANPYDGFNRTPNLSPFLAALLSSIGIPVLLHGLETVSPKYGITPFKLLRAGGLLFPLPISETLSRLKDGNCGWGYVDQEQSFPALFDLLNLRKNMVKRPLIATIEKLLCPIYSEFRHLMVTGYTHPPYRQKSIDLYQHHPFIQEGIIIRGVEGSTQLPLDRRAPFIRCYKQEVYESFVSPEQFNITRRDREPPQSITIEDNLQIGIDALSGKDGWAKDQLIYQSLAIISGFDLRPTEEALSALCLSIETGMALKHWKEGI